MPFTALHVHVHTGQEKAAGNKPLPPPRVPLTASNGNCNNGMPRATRARFLWVINLFARAGFKVGLEHVSGVRAEQSPFVLQCV